MSLNLNIKQVKGNLQRLFDKNLTDLVRGLRNNKDNEVIRFYLLYNPKKLELFNGCKNPHQQI